MGGGGQIGPPVKETVHDGLGQGRALGRVGAGSEFVKKHQGVGVDVRQDAGEMAEGEHGRRTVDSGRCA